MNDMSMNATQAALDTLAVVVFGRDNSRKPHASVFDQAPRRIGREGSRPDGHARVAARDRGGSELAAKLPHGRIFASGRAFVPFVKAGLFASLAAIARG